MSTEAAIFSLLAMSAIFGLVTAIMRNCDASWKDIVTPAFLCIACAVAATARLFIAVFA